MFYNKFVNLCNKKGLSPSAAAEEMGYQRSVVTRWSKGTEPREATIQKVADYFGVDADTLRAKKESPTAQEGSEALKDAGYYRLNEDNKAFIDQMIEKLLKAQSGE